MSVFSIQQPTRFASDERGGVAIIFGLMTSVVIGIVGLAVDYGRLFQTRAHLQMASDAAALAGSQTGTFTEQQRVQMADAVFKANTARHSLTQAAVSDIRVNGKIVTVDAQVSVSTLFMQVLMPNQSTVTNETSSTSNGINIYAVAGAETGDPGQTLGQGCILALDVNGQYGVKINGGSGGSYINANCGMFVNNETTSPIFGNSYGHINTTFTCVRKTYYDTSTQYAVLPTTNCDKVEDPFKDMTKPIVGGCTHTNKSIQNNDSPAAHILYPGTYCGGINITSKKTVTFMPGEYVMTGGQFQMSSQSKAVGSNVFFYLKDTRVSWGSSAQTVFTGITSGTWKGFLFWLDGALSNAHRFGSTSQSKFQGAVYSPQAEIDIQCSGDVNVTADWTVWVVKQLQISSGANLTVNANYATSATPVPTGMLSALARTTPPTPTRLN
jgi:Flp pilus assembly protein TadG